MTVQDWVRVTGKSRAAVEAGLSRAALRAGLAPIPAVSAREMVLAAVKRAPGSDALVLADVAGLNPQVTRKMLNDLVADGLVLATESLVTVKRGKKPRVYSENMGSSAERQGDVCGSREEASRAAG